MAISSISGGSMVFQRLYTPNPLPGAEAGGEAGPSAQDLDFSAQQDWLKQARQGGNSQLLAARTGYPDQRLMDKEEAKVFSDALGLLSRLGGDYRKTAEQMSQLQRNNKIWLSEEANKLGFLEGRGHGDALTEDGQIYVRPQLVERGPRVAPPSRFRQALQLAATLHHERSHYDNKESGWSIDETKAYTKQLQFIRDYYNFEVDSEFAQKNGLMYTEGKSNRLKDILDYGNEVQNSDAAEHGVEPGIFPGGASSRWR